MTLQHPIAAKTPAANPFGPAIAEFRRDLPFWALLFGILIVWSIGVQVIYAIVDGPGVAASDRAGTYALSLAKRTIGFACLFVAIRFVQADRRGGSLLAEVTTTLRERPRQLAYPALCLLLGAVGFVWLQTNFMSAKTAIPAMNGFWLDPFARDWDLALFGKDPWLYFAWIYDHPILLGIIDNAYTIWAGCLAWLWMWAVCSRRMERRRRYQYVLAMVLLWIVAGNLLATALSSVGPVYYGEFFGDAAAYAPLMERLQSVNAGMPLQALEYQDYLLDCYHNPETRFAGISAVPSLHVGATLMMLFLFWRTRIARELLLAYTVMIYVGSIVLAWHYGVDGLIVAPVAWLCWRAAGWIIDRLLPDYSAV